MTGTRPVKVSEGVYMALREMSAKAGSDISTTASFLLLAFIFQTDAHKSLTPATQVSLAADMFEFIAAFAREEAAKLQGGKVTWDDLLKALESLKK